MHVAVEPREVSQEISRVLCHIDLSVSPATSRAIALAILTSPDVMRDVFQTRLTKLCTEERIISHCRSNILKRRLGSRQVIAYRLSFKSDKDLTTQPVELVGKRYANGEEGERVFRTMQMLWEAGFSVGSRFKIPQPFCYISDLKLLLQEKVQGSLLPRYVGRGDAEACARMRMVARWLATLHRHGTIPEGIASCEDDDASIQNFALQLGERYPHLTSRFEALASAIRERITSCKDIPFTLVHGDFHPENIFVTQDGVTVIDFDQFCRSDPARDLGYLIAQMRAMAYRAVGSPDAPNRLILVLLKTYLAHLPLADREAITSRIVAFAARTWLEDLYYIFCVLEDEGPALLATGLQEIERFVKAVTVQEVVS
jgi:tRNA A-37 threonylcarbamoyl transferase component Bud32